MRGTGKARPRKAASPEELRPDLRTEPFCRNYTAASVEEYLEIITFLSRRSKEEKIQEPRLWYRGQKRDLNLLPSLFRGNESASNAPGYTTSHAKEDFRYQHFRSKCNQLVNRRPDSKIEWMELMQHHGVHTRLMDWSESAVTALLFSLEPFLDPDKNSRELSYRRASITPTVWVLNPVRLNRNIYQAFADCPNLLADASRDIIPHDVDESRRKQFLSDLMERLKKKRGDYFLDETDCAIISLSVIENERQANTVHLFRMIESDQFNPYFYLLLRYYNDGLPVRTELLPPLAVIHPYHSQRIQVQHGVFTVTPYYCLDRASEDLRPMEYHPLAADCLKKIRITRPSHVAGELLAMGERLTSLYPEMELYNKDIEADTYML